MKGARILLASALGAAVAAAGASAASGQAEPDARVQQILQNCDAHKFETIIKAVVDGQPRQSKLKLCGKDGQSDAEWVGTLKDAIAKVQANPEMAAAVREQIVTAISAEIARIESGKNEPLKPQAQDQLPDLKPRQLATGRAQAEYSSLPPLPATPPPPPRVLVPSAPVRATGPGASAASAASAAAIPQFAPAFPAPKLSFACFSPGDLGGDAPCAGFERETVLTVRAGEDMRKGVQLRFARNGEARATVDLAQLRRGKSMRIALPRDVCAGFGSGRLDLQVVESGYVVNSDGPYSLRC